MVDANWQTYFREAERTHGPEEAEKLANSIWLFNMRSKIATKKITKVKFIAKVSEKSRMPQPVSSARCVCSE